MKLYRSVRAVAGASGDGPIDWGAAGDAAKAVTAAGSIDLSEADRRGYAEDVADARDAVGAAAALAVTLPDTVEVQNRHHWIDANVETFGRVMEPLADQGPSVMPTAARVVNTGTMTFMLSFLAKHVLGQYDPVLLADDDEHALYFVEPNIRRTADQLDVAYPRFRRWIAFHEVTHAAEFGAAPWLSDYLETRMERGVEALAGGSVDREAFRELDATMTAVEGYAELLMDRAFDDEYADLREKVEARRRGGGPLAWLVRKMLGLGLKRRQYERGQAFFDAVVEARGVEAAGRVWESPENLPTDDELDDPSLWLARVGE